MSENNLHFGDRVEILTGKYTGQTGIIANSPVISGRKPNKKITCDINIIIDNKTITITFEGSLNDLKVIKPLNNPKEAAVRKSRIPPSGKSDSLTQLAAVHSSSNISLPSLTGVLSASSADICSLLGSKQISPTISVGDLVQVKNTKGVWTDDMITTIQKKGQSTEFTTKDSFCTFSQENIRKQELFRCIAIDNTSVILSKKGGQVSSVLPDITIDFEKFFSNSKNLTSETIELLENLKQMNKPYNAKENPLGLGTSRETLDTKQKSILENAFNQCLSIAKRSPNNSDAIKTLFKIICEMIGKSAADTDQMREGALAALINELLWMVFSGSSSDGTCSAALVKLFDFSLFCRKSSEGKLDDKYYILTNNNILQYFFLLVNTISTRQADIDKFFSRNFNGQPISQFFSERVETSNSIIEKILDFINTNKITLQDLYASEYFRRTGKNILTVTITDLIKWIEENGLQRREVDLNKMKIYLKFYNDFEDFLKTIIPPYNGSNNSYGQELTKGQKIFIPQWLFDMFINMNLGKINKSKSEEELNLEALRALILDLIRGHDFNINNLESIRYIFPTLFKDEEWEFLKENLTVDRSVLQFLDRFDMPGICLMNKAHDGDVKGLFFECAMLAERIYDSPTEEEKLTGLSDGNFFKGAININQVVISADFSTTKSVGRGMWVKDTIQIINLINEYLRTTQPNFVSADHFMELYGDMIPSRFIEFCGASAEYDSAANTGRPTIQFNYESCMKVSAGTTGRFGIAIKTMCKKDIPTKKIYLRGLFDRICVPDFTDMWVNIPVVQQPLSTWFNQCLIKIMEIIKQDTRKGVSVIKTKALLKNIIKNFKSKKFTEFTLDKPPTEETLALKELHSSLIEEITRWTNQRNFDNNPELRLIELLTIYANKLNTVTTNERASNMYFQKLMDLINDLPSKQEAELLALAKLQVRTQNLLSTQSTIHETSMTNRNVTLDTVTKAVNDCLQIFNNLETMRRLGRSEVEPILIQNDILEFIYDIVVELDKYLPNIETYYQKILEKARSSIDFEEGYLIKKIFGDRIVYLEYKYLLLACVIYKLKVQGELKSSQMQFLETNVKRILERPTDIEHNPEMCDIAIYDTSIHPLLQDIIDKCVFAINKNQEQVYFPSTTVQLEFLIQTQKITFNDYQKFMNLIDCPNIEQIPTCLRRYISENGLLLSDQGRDARGLSTMELSANPKNMLRSSYQRPDVQSLSTVQSSVIAKKMLHSSGQVGLPQYLQSSHEVAKQSPLIFGHHDYKPTVSLFNKPRKIDEISEVSLDNENLDANAISELKNKIITETFQKIISEEIQDDPEIETNLIHINPDDIDLTLNLLLKNTNNNVTETQNLFYMILLDYQTKKREDFSTTLLSIAETYYKEYKKSKKEGGRPSTRGRKQKVNRFTKDRNRKLRKGKGTRKTYRKKNKTRRR